MTKRSDLIPGDEVLVFLDPYTQQQLEGKAILVQYEFTESDTPAVEWWQVRFKPGGKRYSRCILV